MFDAWQTPINHVERYYCTKVQVHAKAITEQRCHPARPSEPSRTVATKQRSVGHCAGSKPVLTRGCIFNNDSVCELGNDALVKRLQLGGDNWHTYIHSWPRWMYERNAHFSLQFSRSTIQPPPAQPQPPPLLGASAKLCLRSVQTL